MSRKLVQIVEQYMNVVMHHGVDCEGTRTLRERFADVPGFTMMADIADANIERGRIPYREVHPEAIPTLDMAMRPVAREIMTEEPSLFAGSWNTSHHVEITLTIAECRDVVMALEWVTTGGASIIDEDK